MMQRGNTWILTSQWARQINEARQSLYQLVGADKSDTFVLTSSLAESITQAFHSMYMHVVRTKGKNHILVGNLEGSATLLNGTHFEKLGCIVDQVSVNSQGFLTEEILNLYTTPKTGALFLSLSNPLTGVLQSISDLAEYCQRHDIFFHLNIDDAIGKVFFQFCDEPIDMISFGGPVGCGALFVKQHTSLVSLIPTAASLNPYRGGEFSIDLFLQFGKWAQHLSDEMDQASMHLAHLRDTFEHTLTAMDTHIAVLFQDVMRIPSMTTIVFPKVSAELLLLYFRERLSHLPSFGGEEIQKLEYLLTKCGIETRQAKSALSFSFYMQQTEEDIIQMAHDVIDVYHELLHISMDITFKDV